MSKKKWTDIQLQKAVIQSTSIRQVLVCLGLAPAGGNYVQIQKAITSLQCNTSHFTGKVWNKGKKVPYNPKKSLSEILIKNSTFQSHKLKKRLFKERIFSEKCSMCGWNKMALDGRIPLELDHINGDKYDNRIENLRILCPNCHSLQLTHRGKNKKKG